MKPYEEIDLNNTQNHKYEQLEYYSDHQRKLSTSDINNIKSYFTGLLPASNINIVSKLEWTHLPQPIIRIEDEDELLSIKDSYIVEINIFKCEDDWFWVHMWSVNKFGKNSSYKRKTLYKCDQTEGIKELINDLFPIKKDFSERNLKGEIISGLTNIINHINTVDTTKLKYIKKFIDDWDK